MSKRSKWSPTDPKHFEGKSLPDLQRELVRANAFTDKDPAFGQGWHNEYVQELKRRIADQIGRSKGAKP